MCQSKRDILLAELCQTAWLKQRVCAPEFLFLMKLKIAKTYLDCIICWHFKRLNTVNSICFLTDYNSNTLNLSFLRSSCAEGLPQYIVLSFTYGVITVAIRLWYDYNPNTTYRACLLPFDVIRRKQKMNMSSVRRSRIVVISRSNRMHVVILITFVVVECVVESSYRSRIAAVESNANHNFDRFRSSLMHCVIVVS